MILVVGATGTLGGRIVRGLLAQGKDVRILVRDPSPSVELAPIGLATDAESLVAAGAQRVTGDLTDRPSLAAACAGVETVITTATAAKRDGDLEAVDLHGTLALRAAASEAGANHFIYTSAYGATVGHPMPMLHVKGTCEQALVDSGLTWTILQPALLCEVVVPMVLGPPLQAQVPVTLVADGRHRHSYISEVDVAAFAIAAVDHPAAKDTRLELGGPSYSWREIVDAAGAALGHELPVRFVPAGDPLPLLDPAISSWLPAFETYEDFIDMGDRPAQFGVELTPLATIMAQMFASHNVVPEEQA
jgi:NADH dehydrogenase